MLAIMTKVDTELYLIICMITSRLLDAGTWCNIDTNDGCHVIGLMNAIPCKAGIFGDPVNIVLEPETGFFKDSLHVYSAASHC